MKTITVTIHPEVTVIAAETEFYRYDQPGPHELAEYCASIAGAPPGECRVNIAGEGADDVAAACRALGFQTEVLAPDSANEHPEPGEIGDAPFAQEPEWVDLEGPELSSLSELPGRGPREAAARPSVKFPAIVLGLAVVAVMAAGAWAIVTTTSASPTKIAEPGHDTTQPSALPAEGPAPETSSPPAESSVTPTVLSHEGLTISAPTGFQLVDEGDMWLASGDDPDFRLNIAVDDLYGLPPDQLMQQVERDIADDPELTLINAGPDRIEYEQVAPDGSYVAWTTWVEEGAQISLGCHSRAEATTVHRAACAMANNTVDYEKPT